jgi:hypothetical protein
MRWMVTGRTRSLGPATTRDDASVARDDVRDELKPLYEAGELDHDEMAARLKITKSQLQSQLNKMFHQRQLSPRGRGRRPR